MNRKYSTGELVLYVSVSFMSVVLLRLLLNVCCLPFTGKLVYRFLTVCSCSGIGAHRELIKE